MKSRKLPIAVLSTNDPRSYPTLGEVRNRLAAARDDYEWQLWTMEPNGLDQDWARHFYRDYRPPAGRVEDLAQQARLRHGLDPAAQYRSEYLYLDGMVTEEQVLRKTVWTMDRFARLLEDNDIRFLFQPSGGTLYSNVLMNMALARGVRAYRTIPAGYLDPGPSARHFFCENNMSRLEPEENVDRTSPRFTSALEHAREYVSSVREASFAPDAEARRISSLNHVSTGQMFLSLAKCVAGTLRGDRRLIWRRHRRIVGQWSSKLYLDLSRRKLPSDKPYLLFTLHYPKDSQLTLRAQWFLDQVALVRLLSCSMPAGVELWVKEHPGYPGMVPMDQVRYVRKRLAHVRFLDYAVPFRQVVGNCAGLITINSTAGVEALIHGKPVICLGEGFYRGQGLTRDIENLKEFSRAARDVLIEGSTATPERVVDVLARFLYACEPVGGQEAPPEKVSEILYEGIRARVSAAGPGGI